MFINRCLIKDYEQRPMISELLTHPFIKQVPYYADKVTVELLIACLNESN